MCWAPPFHWPISCPLGSGHSVLPQSLKLPSPSHPFVHAVLSLPECYPQPQRCLSSLILLVSNIHLWRSFHWVLNQYEFLFTIRLWDVYLFISSIITVCNCIIIYVIIFECVYPYLSVIRDSIYFLFIYCVQCFQSSRGRVLLAFGGMFFLVQGFWSVCNNKA